MAEDKLKPLTDIHTLAQETNAVVGNKKAAHALDETNKVLSKASAVGQLIAQGASGDVVGSAMNVVAQFGGEKVAKNVAKAQQVIQVANTIKKIASAPLPSLSELPSRLGLSMSSPSGLQFTFKAFNLPEDTFSVVAFEGEEHYSSLFTFNIALVSASPNVEFGKVLDYLGTLSVHRDGKLLRTFTGMVVEFEKGETGFHQTHYHLQLCPEYWRTTLRTNSRIFQQKDLKSIVSTILSEHGITQYAYNLKNPHPPREFCVQYQESDYAFLSRLLAEEGVFFYFEFAPKQHTLVFCDNADSLLLGKTIQYNPNPEATRRESMIWQFKRAERIRVSSAQLRDYTFKKPSWNAQFGKQASDIDYQRQVYEYFEYPARFKQAERGEAFTQYRLESLRNEAHLGQGESNATNELVLGERFSLFNHPDSQLNCPWQVIAIHHEGRQPQGAEREAHQSTGTHYQNQFQFIPITQTWRPVAIPKPQIFGPQMAMVVGPKGEEIFTDKFGRVKVQFLWDRYGQGNDRSSCWIRVSQPWAGAGYGGIAIPRIGQEVIVSFLDGDPDQPIIIGRTYHATNLPPGKLPGAATQTIIKSQSHKSKGANELRMEDATGKEEFYLHAQRDMNTVIKNQQQTTVQQGNKTLVLEQGSYLSDIKSGQFSEKIAQGKITEANSVSVKATQGKNAPGTQIYEADDSITLKVGDNASLLLNNNEIQLKFGDSLIKLTAQGIFLNGTQIGLNNEGVTATAVENAKNAMELTALAGKGGAGGGGRMAYGGKVEKVKSQSPVKQTVSHIDDRKGINTSLDTSTASDTSGPPKSQLLSKESTKKGRAEIEKIVHEKLDKLGYSPEEKAMFLATVRHESANYTKIIEDGRYSLKGLLKTSSRARKDPKAAEEAIKAGPEKIFELMYGFRKDLGNDEPGDGAKYIGRGIIQVTGKYNYKMLSKDLGVDLVSHPELLATNSELAVKSAVLWWEKNKKNSKKFREAIQNGDFKAVTQVVNGGNNGEDSRNRIYNQLLQEIKKKSEK